MSSPSFASRGLPALVGLCCFFSVVLLVSSTGLDVGISWAEDDHLDHLDGMRTWLLAVMHGQATPELHAEVWERNVYFHPPPPLYKWLALLSRALWPSLPFAVSERLPGAMVLGITCAAVVLALWSRVGPGTAAAGGALLVTLPRLFGHAHFLSADIFLLCGWILASLCHVRWLETGRRWWAAGVIAALAFALCCKLTAMLMVIPLGLASLAVRGPRSLRTLTVDAAILTAGLVVAFGLLCVVHPLTWEDPLTQLWVMVGRTRHWGQDNSFSMFYFGETLRYTDAPWHFTLVMAFLLTPPLILALALLGAVGGCRLGALRTMILVQIGFWLVFPVIPKFPKYDNERQILPLFGNMAFWATVGLHVAAQALTRWTQPVAAVFSTAVTVSSRHLPPWSGLSVQPAPGLGRFLKARGFLRQDLNLSELDGPFFIVFQRVNGLFFPGLVKDRDLMLLVAKVEHLGVDVAQLWYLPPPTHGSQTP